MTRRMIKRINFSIGRICCPELGRITHKTQAISYRESFKGMLVLSLLWMPLLLPFFFFYFHACSLLPSLQCCVFFKSSPRFLRLKFGRVTRFGEYIDNAKNRSAKLEHLSCSQICNNSAAFR